MFRENPSPMQPPLLGKTVNELSETKQALLEASWAGAFRSEVLLRLDEKPFAVLYAEVGSRPNVPVNQLLGWEMLKSGFGASDEEMHERFLFDIQVRYALGVDDLNEGDFALRTVYNFRSRLWAYNQKNGKNLIDQAFEQVTDEQLRAFKISSCQLRADTTQIASDIAQMSRLQLLVEVVQRMQRTLSPADQERYGECFAPYIKGKSQQYIYCLKRDEYAPSLVRIGGVLAQLVVELAAAYGDTPAYQMVCRVFDEHFVDESTSACEPNLALVDGSETPPTGDGLKLGVRPKVAAELAAASLQSPDDPDATYRHKAGQAYRGYVANIVETCDPENEVNLIVKVQTASNNADDADLLRDALPNLLERTDVKIIHSDGGFHSPALDEDLAEAQVEQHLTAIRGSQPDPARIGLAHFEVEYDVLNNPILLRCPEGQEIPVESGRNLDRFIARPAPERCASCPLFQLCAALPHNPQAPPVIYFDRQTLRTAHKRRLITQQRGGPQLRPAVEATVRSVKHPLPHGKAPVRGKFRVASIILASAFMVNLRRLHSFLTQKSHQPDPKTPDWHPFSLFASLFSPHWARFTFSPPFARSPATHQLISGPLTHFPAHSA
jgi:hypothetical protein